MSQENERWLLDEGSILVEKELHDGSRGYVDNKTGRLTITKPKLPSANILDRVLENLFKPVISALDKITPKSPGR